MADNAFTTLIKSIFNLADIMFLGGQSIYHYSALSVNDKKLTAVYHTVEKPVILSGKFSTMNHIEKALLFAKTHGHEVKGTFLVPVHVYSGPDSSLDGQLCVVLGKERCGVYANKFNFFGGKVEGNTPVQNLVKEVEEELCISLSERDLDACVFGAQLRGKTLVIFAHITGLSRSIWKSVMKQRDSRGEAYERREMSEIRHVPVLRLVNDTSVSETGQRLLSDDLQASKLHVARTEACASIPDLQSSVKCSAEVFANSLRPHIYSPFQFSGFLS